MSWFSGLFRNKSTPEPEAIDIRAEVAEIRTPRPTNSPEASGLPSFQGTASDQLRDGHRGPLDIARFRLRDAFTPSRPINRPQMFAGRTQVLRTLIRAIEEQHLHVVLYGERGIGKTSLLNILSQLAQNAKYIVRYVSCSEDADFNTTFRSILRDLPLLYHRDYAPTSEEAERGGTLEDLAGDAPLSVAKTGELLARLANTRVVIILDEYDRAANPAFRGAIAELIKTLSDRSVRVQLVIAGVASSLTELIDRIPSIRRNILGLQVPNMNDEEIAQLVRNGQSVSGLGFATDVVRFITSFACGSPYIASLLSQYAGIVALDRGATTVEKSDVVAAIHQSLVEIRQRVPTDTLYRIEQAYQAGYSSVLGLLACTALNAGGAVQPSIIAEVAQSEGWAPGCMEEIEHQFGLIGRLSSDPTGAYHFIEEGVPIYLWMNYAEGELCRKDSYRKD